VSWIRAFVEPAWWAAGTAARVGVKEGAINHPGEPGYRQRHLDLRWRRPWKQMPEQVRLTEFETQLIESADEHISRLHERWQLKHQRLESRLNKLDYECATLEKAHREACRRLEAVGFRQPHSILPKWAYLPVMIVLATLEFPFNFEAFKILRVPPSELALLALGPSVAIPFLAHFIGTLIRQWTKRDGILRPLVIGLIATGSLLGGTLSIGLLRARFVASLTEQPVDMQNALALLGVNLLFLSMGVVAAYFAHDPDAELEQTAWQERHSGRRLRRATARRARLDGRFDELRNVLKEQQRQIREKTLEMIAEYRRYNRYQRTAEAPSWFQDPIQDWVFKWRKLSEQRAKPKAEKPALGEVPEVFQTVSFTTDPAPDDATAGSSSAAAGRSAPVDPGGAS
jgi:hypothetical protein